MDPLSITASIIAVLQATNAVVSICKDYRSAAKASSWEYSQVISELESLRNVLKSLAELASNSISTRGKSDPSLSMLTKFCDPSVGQLGKCLAELETLKGELAPPSWSGVDGLKRRALIQALGWPLKRDETIKTLESIGRFKATLGLALSSDQIAMTQNIRDATDSIQVTTLNVQQDVRELNSSVERMRLETHHQDILRWLSAPDPSTNFNNALKKRQAGTGSWLICNARFVEWKEHDDSVLWLYGSPGCGKTILASTIIENVLEYSQNKFSSTANPSQTQAVLYYYFAFNDDDKTVAEKMLCSLMTQLLLQNRDTYTSLEAAFPYYSSLRQRPTMDELSSAFLSMLREMDETFIVFDALDECINREELLAFIRDVSDIKLRKIHLLFTSRRERDIEDVLHGLTGEEDRICIQSALVDGDIRTYVQGRLRTDPKLKRWQKAMDVQQEIERTLLSKADGMFRWVQCQLDALGKCLNLSMLRKALASLPKSLDDTYARILSNIEEDYTEYVLKILHWLTFSTRLLQVKELAEVLAVDVEADPQFDPDRRLTEPKDILDICSSLVSIETQTVVEDVGMTIRIIQGEVVRLAHFSVQEYLISERIKTGPVFRYAIDKESANMAIAETCLAYILHLRNPPSLIPQTVEEYPLARYAAESWSQHADLAGSRSAIMNALIRELFTPDSNPYMNWTILYDHNSGNTSDYQASSVPPLYYAAETGCVDVVQEMLNGDIDVNSKGGFYSDALHLAISRRDKKLIETLISHGADINARGNAMRGTLLDEALQLNDVGLLEELLEIGAEVRRGDSCYQNPILIAARKVNPNPSRGSLELSAAIPESRISRTCLELILHFTPSQWTTVAFCETYLEALEGAQEAKETGEGKVTLAVLLESARTEELESCIQMPETYPIGSRLISEYLEEQKNREKERAKKIEELEAQARMLRPSRYKDDMGS